MSQGEQGLRYLLVGAFNTVFGLGLFALLITLAGDSVHYLAILVGTTIVAVLIAFVLYRRLIFRVQGNVLRDLARFSLVYAGAFAANVVVLPLLVEGASAGAARTGARRRRHRRRELPRASLGLVSR